MPPEPTAAPEAEKPEEPEKKPEAAPKKDPEPASALHSRYQKQVAEARKDADAAKRDAATARTEAEESRRYAKVLEERGDVGEDEKGRYEDLAKREAAAGEMETKARSAVKLASARLLHSEYGVSEDTLLAFDDPRDMKIAALEWQRDNPKTDDDPPTEEPKPKAKTPEPAESRQASTGVTVRDRVRRSWT
ncbi:MAG: hypothetical protein IIC94_07075 [Chloroflexi bacterium]|nr:hypothetical protein [Chloroflexota bacterium]